MLSTGYLSSLYALSLDDLGIPLELPASKGWILKRPILGTNEFDGMGCYPIFACQNWSSLKEDLDWVSNQLVSLSIVTDPFGAYDSRYLAQCFIDIARPYKEHFVVDLKKKPKEFVISHHQRNARNSLKKINIEICTEPIKYLDEWLPLYDNLIERHHIRGIAQFSKTSFVQQLQVPGIIAFRAVSNSETVGMLLWYVQGNIGYYHLGAYSSIGYRLNASFALFWTLLEYFADTKLHWLSLGAGAGIHEDKENGLTRFKQGWSTETRTAYFCGRIFDHNKYQEIVSLQNIGSQEFFPAYRAAEHGQ